MGVILTLARVNIRRERQTFLNNENQQASIRMLHKIIKIFNDGILIFDNGQCIFHNQQVLKILDLDKGRMLLDDLSISQKDESSVMASNFNQDLR